MEIVQQVDIEQRAGVGYDEVVLLLLPLPLLPLLLAEDQGTIRWSDRWWKLGSTAAFKL